MRFCCFYFAAFIFAATAGLAQIKWVIKYIQKRRIFTRGRNKTAPDIPKAYHVAENRTNIFFPCIAVQRGSRFCKRLNCCAVKDTQYPTAIPTPAFWACETTLIRRKSVAEYNNMASVGILRRGQQRWRRIVF
jgi:hypothetical protein